MLPSMPILFTRESRDGFGNKIEPSNCFFGQSSVSKTAIIPEVSQSVLLFYITVLHFTNNIYTTRSYV